MRDVRAENGEQLCDSGYKLPSRSRLSLSIEARVHTCISPLLPTGENNREATRRSRHS